MITSDQFFESIEATYPAGMTEADIAIEMNHHGVREMTARILARRIYKGNEQVNDRVDAGMAAVEMYSKIYDSNREWRRKQMLERVGNCSVAQFTDGYWTLIVHPSTRRPGKWQLSRLDKHGPYGHNDFDRFEDAIASAIGAHADSWYDEGTSKFELVKTAGVREQQLTMCQ